ncbi:MAG: glycosyltransferase family 2 protein [Candidatus Woesearchaeota archaeon]
MKKPFISVLMPNYNCEKYLAEAIESILNQTYKNFEFIIVDDASTDNSWNIIQRYAKKDKRIKPFRNKKNLGRPSTRNKLLSLISNKANYFLWMDSDDVVLKELIKDKVSYLEKNKELFGLGSSIDYVDENLNFIKRRTYPKTSKDVRNKFLLFSPLSQGGLMLRAELNKYKYNSEMSVAEDYELWCRLISKGYKFENLKKSYYLYRQFEGQAKIKNLKKTIWNTLKIKSNYLFKPRFFEVSAFLRFILEAIALLLPKKLILWVFYKSK